MRLKTILASALASTLLAGSMALAPSAFAQQYSPPGPPPGVVTLTDSNGNQATINTSNNTVTFTPSGGGPAIVVNLNNNTVTVNGQVIPANSPAAQQALETARGLSTQYAASAAAATLAQQQAQQLAQQAAKCGSASNPKCTGLYQQAAVAAARATQLTQQATAIRQKLVAAVQNIAKVIKPSTVPSTGFGGTAPKTVAAAAPLPAAANRLPGGAGVTVSGTTFTGALANLRAPVQLPKTGGAAGGPDGTIPSLLVGLLLLVCGFGLRSGIRHN